MYTDTASDYDREVIDVRVGDAVVATLADHGFDAVFGIPGKQTLPLNQAMAEHGVRYVVARHETAVTH